MKSGAIAALSLLCPLAGAFRGVHPDDLAKYAGEQLQCPPPDRPIRLTRDQINDQYCDCPLTGFDEPGTAACPTGKRRFWCPNAGHVSKLIPHAHVDDGRCDCCDGSDETPGRCQNRCEAERAAHLERQRIRRAMLSKALEEKDRLAQKGAASRATMGQRLAELQGLIMAERALILQPPPQSEEVDDVDPELVSDDRRQRLEAILLKLLQGGSREAALTSFESYLEEFSVGSEGEKTKDADSDYGDQDAKESGEGEADDDPEGDTDAEDNDYEGKQPVKKSRKAESTTRKLKSRLNNLWQVLCVKTTETVTKYLLSEPTRTLSQQKQQQQQQDVYAATLRSFQSRLRQRITQYESEVKQLTQKIGQSSGKLPGEPLDDSFLGLDGTCYSSKLGEYTYEICPFNNVTQRELHGAMQLLGRWQGWREGRMQYGDGSHCWQGPQRSASVKIKCGAVNEIVAASEPSVCSYALTFSTPAACTAAEQEDEE